jgi:peptidoglycan/xylan/chitin deacetylase (PgdA/CDA1 family)
MGLYDWQLRKLASPGWIILMYHRVIDDSRLDPFSLGMCVTRDHFDDQISYLQRHFNPIGIRDAVARVQRSEPLPDRAVSITFDDGYLDNYQLALPILEKRQIPMTLFVPTGGLDTDEPLWWDRVIHAFATTTKSSLAPQSAGIPLPSDTLSLSPWKRGETAELVLESLWTLPMDKVKPAVLRIERELLPPRSPGSKARRMTSQQILDMHRRGVEIAAHSVDHPNLSLETPAQVRWEMQTSKRILEHLCGSPVDGFAYPAGWMNDDTVSAAKESGFRYAVTTKPAFNSRQIDLLKLSRIGMPDTSAADFKRALISIARRKDKHQ